MSEDRSNDRRIIAGFLCLMCWCTNPAAHGGVAPEGDLCIIQIGFFEAHFAVFPETLVETCISAGCPPQGLVLDPFLGSGTTAVVACRLGRNYLGIDCNSDYCDMARRRLKGAGHRSSPGPRLFED